MNGFDDLLYEVLREDGNQQLPPGMNKRILAALPHKNHQFPGQSAMRVGLAAAMLIGVFDIATWILVHTSRSPMVATYSDQRSLERSANPHASGEAGRTHLPSSAQKPRDRKPILHRPIWNQLSSQQRSIRITPVVIDPLLIKPIEIASITPRGSATKGKLR
jgi:hypothetical protein